MPNLKYQRIMFKLSGEALLGSEKYGIDYRTLKDYANQLIEIADLGTEVLVEVGGGNIYRWRTAQSGITREVADTMGMLGSVMNAMNFSAQNPDRIKALSTVKIDKFVDEYSTQKVRTFLKAGKIIIIGGGLGNQFFTTDTGAVAHALQNDCDVVIKGTNVEGVFDADPKTHPGAKKYSEISYDEVLAKNLNVMDMTAFALCRDNSLPIVVFNMLEKGNIKKAALGEVIGTKVY